MREKTRVEARRCDRRGAFRVLRVDEPSRGGGRGLVRLALVSCCSTRAHRHSEIRPFCRRNSVGACQSAHAGEPVSAARASGEPRSARQSPPVVPGNKIASARVGARSSGRARAVRAREARTLWGLVFCGGRRRRDRYARGVRSGWSQFVTARRRCCRDAEPLTEDSTCARADFAVILGSFGVVRRRSEDSRDFSRSAVPGALIFTWWRTRGRAATAGVREEHVSAKRA